MENIARDFAQADQWNRRGFKWRRIDRFGSMYGFHVRGSYTYQTKVGAMLTIFYLCLVMATFAFYIMKWRDKSKPFVMWNQYKDVEFAAINLSNENFQIYFIPMNLSTGLYYSWEYFWSSWHMYASILDMAEHRLKSGDYWDRIPFEKCGAQQWYRDLPAGDLNDHLIQKYALCMDPTKIEAGPRSKLSKGLQVSGGKIEGSQRIMIDLFKCLPGGGAPTKGLEPDCKQKAPNLGLLTYLYEKTVNVKFYEDPIKSTAREIDRLIPANSLRFMSEITLKWIDLYTDVGFLVKDLKHQPVPSVETFGKNTSEKTMTNIRRNYLSQGKVIMADFDYHLEISTTNDKAEVYRYYFTVIDVFSAVGGL